MSSSTHNVKPYAGLSLDLDNEWSYQKAHADVSWKDYPSYFEVAIPRILSLLDEFGLKITFFIVGKDASLEKNHEVLSSIVKAGHDVGNHSFKHEPWLHRYSEAEFEDDLRMAEEAIVRATGARPCGFRGPGYSMFDHALKVLSHCGYLYDSSTLPMVIGPLARAYFFWTSSFDSQQRQERELLFGSFRDVLRPLRPYRWRVEKSSILELPLTTYPIVRMPFHMSYVLYMSKFSPFLAQYYWRSALSMCRLDRLEPNLLLHPLDFMCKDDAASIAFFPGMDIPLEAKLERVRKYLKDFTDNYTVLSLNKFATDVNSRPNLEFRKPDFRTGR
jgi:peptidoglycan-N-acetylglucosamine deacetylase